MFNVKQKFTYDLLLRDRELVKPQFGFDHDASPSIVIFESLTASKEHDLVHGIKENLFVKFFVLDDTGVQNHVRIKPVFVGKVQICPTSQN